MEKEERTQSLFVPFTGKFWTKVDFSKVTDYQKKVAYITDFQFEQSTFSATNVQSGNLLGRKIPFCVYLFCDNDDQLNQENYFQIEGSVAQKNCSLIYALQLEKIQSLYDANNCTNPRFRVTYKKMIDDMRIPILLKQNKSPTFYIVLENYLPDNALMNEITAKTDPYYPADKDSFLSSVTDLLGQVQMSDMTKKPTDAVSLTSANHPRTLFADNAATSGYFVSSLQFEIRDI